MEVYGFGFNGFGQLTTPPIQADHYDDSVLLVLEPLALSIDIDDLATKLRLKSDSGATYGGDDLARHRPGDNTEGNSVQTHSTGCQDQIANIESITNKGISDISISWDTIMFVLDNGQMVLRGALEKNKSIHSLIHCPLLASGSLSWKGVYLTDQDGICTASSASRVCQYAEPRQVVVKEADVMLHLDEGRSIQAIKSGGLHTVAITDSKRVGLIELKDDGYVLTPLQLNVSIREVSCGKEHVLLLSRIGVVFSFGGGGQCQLGHGSIENEAKPRVIEALEGVSMVTVAAGGWHSVAVSDIGDMYVWGWNERGQLGFPSKIVQEQTKAANPQAKEANIDPKAGTTDLINIQPYPLLLDIAVSPIKGLDHIDDVESAVSDVVVSKVSCGSRHTAAVTDRGELYTWGWNDYGQLGHGDTVSRDAPSKVTYFADNDFSVFNVYCGFWNTVVIVKKSL